MPTYTSIKSYRKALKRRFKGAIKAGDDGAAKASYVLQSRLKRDAPTSSGKLAKNIIRWKQKRGEYYVSAGYVPPGAPFNIARWVNQEFKITPKIPGGKASMALKTPVGQSVRYGDNNGVQWTAKKKPWHTLNLRSVVKEYRKVNINNVRKKLRKA
jgi:hypothetical protein